MDISYVYAGAADACTPPRQYILDTPPGRDDDLVWEWITIARAAGTRSRQLWHGLHRFNAGSRLLERNSDFSDSLVMAMFDSFVAARQRAAHRTPI